MSQRQSLEANIKGLTDHLLVLIESDPNVDTLNNAKMIKSRLIKLRTMLEQTQEFVHASLGIVDNSIHSAELLVGKLKAMPLIPLASSTHASSTDAD